LRRSGNSQHPGLTALKQPGLLTDAIGDLQETSAFPEHLLSHAGKREAASNAIEQFEAEFAFESIDLS
jgi:hypothetical protein